MPSKSSETDVFREHEGSFAARMAAFLATNPSMDVGTGGLGTDALSVGLTPTPITQIAVYMASLTPGSVLAAISGEQTFSVPGLTTADTVIVSGPAPTAGTGIVNARVSSADTLALTFLNATLGVLTPVSGTYRVLAIRS